MADFTSLVSNAMNSIKGGARYEENQRSRAMMWSMFELVSAMRENTSAARRNTSVVNNALSVVNATLQGGITVSGTVSTVSASV